MCEICNVEPGDYAPLITEDVEVVINNRKLLSQLLCFGIMHNSDGTYELEATYFVDNNDPIAKIKVELDYCPFCGRKLPQKEKVYPWGKGSE